MRRSDVKKAHDEKLARSVHVSTLVQVIAFSPDAMTVDVQPMIKVKIDGEYVSQPPLIGVPVACICAGTFMIRPWYVPGDVGMVVFGDADMDAALMSGSESEPTTARGHAMDDAQFVGGICAGGKLPQGLPDETIALMAGETFVAIGEDQITVKGDVEITGDIKITGDVVMNGTFSLNGIVLNSHVHGASPGPS